LLRQFANGEDVYKHMASQIYGTPVENITKAKRFVGKVAVLGLGYGMGWRKFLATITLGLMGPKMALDTKEAQVVVDTYRRTRHAIKTYWKLCDHVLTRMVNDMDGELGLLRIDGTHNRLYLPNDLYLEYPGLAETNDGFVYFDYENADILARGGVPNSKRGRKIYGGLLTENITQAIARIIVGEQLLQIARQYRVVMTTHDEIVATVPEAEADAGLSFMLDVMRTPPAWASGLPLNAEGGYAREYSK
jgi:hypothetical protein